VNKSFGKMKTTIVKFNFRKAHFLTSISNFLKIHYSNFNYIYPPKLTYEKFYLPISLPLHIY